MPLRGHAISVSILGTAFLATAAVFLFARPQYRPAGGGGHAISGTRYPAPAHGWVWSHGLPGGGMSGESADFLLAGVTRAELAPARAAARRAGVDPSTVRPLHVARYANGRQGLAAIVAGTGARGRTCLGFVVPGKQPSFVCPQRQRAFVIATAMPIRDGTYGMFLLGIASGEVVRATDSEHEVWGVWQPSRSRTVQRSGLRTRVLYSRDGGWWGTFLDTLGSDRPWRATVTIHGAHGKLATLPIRMDAPGSRLFVVR